MCSPFYKYIDIDQAHCYSAKMNKQINRSRLPNDKLRGRRNLLPDEIELICKEVHNGSSRYKLRDELMIRMVYHHGLRPSELTNMQWEQISISQRKIDIERVNNGINSTHIITSNTEYKLLTEYHEQQGHPIAGNIFTNERGNNVSVNGFQQAFGQYSEKALGVKWNLTGLRHACGMSLAAKGIDIRVAQVYLGIRNIQNVARYY